MPDTITSNFSFTKPEISGSPDTWGNKLNTNFDAIDTQIKNTQDNVETRVKKDGTTPFTAAQVGVSPTVSTHLATKGYVDTKIAANLAWLLPLGTIVMWGGSLGDIPLGWSLCNGAVVNGIPTPNLVDRFILGAGVQAAHNVGGAWTHDHTGVTGDTYLDVSTMPNHSHGVYDPGHGHSVNDAGHYHGYISNTAWNRWSWKTDTDVVVEADHAAGYQPNQATQVAYTGITLNNSATSIGIFATGGGAPHHHAIVASAHTPPYYTLAFICKTGAVAV